MGDLGAESLLELLGSEELVLEELENRFDNIAEQHQLYLADDGGDTYIVQAMKSRRGRDTDGWMGVAMSKADLGLNLHSRDDGFQSAEEALLWAVSRVLGDHAHRERAGG